MCACLENAPDLQHAEGLGVTVSDQADQQHTSFAEFFIIVLFSNTQAGTQRCLLVLVHQPVFLDPSLTLSVGGSFSMELDIFLFPLLSLLSLYTGQYDSVAG